MLIPDGINITPAEILHESTPMPGDSWDVTELRSRAADRAVDAIASGYVGSCLMAGRYVEAVESIPAAPKTVYFIGSVFAAVSVYNYCKAFWNSWRAHQEEATCPFQPSDQSQV